MTLNVRPSQGLVFALLLAMSLWMSATAAIADTRPHGSPNLFDPGFVDNRDLLRRPLGHLGVSWE
jgi:hypothetical protein